MGSIYCIAYVPALMKPTLPFSGVLLFADPVSLVTYLPQNQQLLHSWVLKIMENFSVLRVTEVSS